MDEPPSRPRPPRPGGGLGRAAAPQRRAHLEFLRRESLSCGLYVLEAGPTTPQEPHQEDEVYLVLEGRARLEAAGQDQPAGLGGVVFVARTVPLTASTTSPSGCRCWSSSPRPSG